MKSTISISQDINNEIDKSYYSQYSSIQELISSSLGKEKCLYKYLPLNEDIDFVQDILQNNTIKSNDPTQFNDPFECMSIVGLVNYDSFRVALSNLTKSNEKQYDESVFVKEYDEFVKNVRKEYLEKILAKYGILCFSGIWDNILMWSHYASHHKGIVLVFRYDEKSSFYENMMKVRYKDGIEYFNLSHINAPKKIWESFSTKHSIWSYEQEYRIIYRPSEISRYDGSGIKNFPRNILKGIIFGLRINNQHKNDIIRWVSIYYPSLKLYETSIKDREIGIEKKCIN